ncbi:MAG: hypothetical protein MK524_15705 [SAR202 cluster bacterium]|nr:hypothetical protein [SAR202 cluster bacterium]
MTLFAVILITLGLNATAFADRHSGGPAAPADAGGGAGAGAGGDFDASTVAVLDKDQTGDLKPEALAGLSK